MKTTGLILSSTLALVLTAIPARAADDAPEIKLSEVKFKLQEGVGSDLVKYDDIEEKVSFYAPGTAVWTFEVARAGDHLIKVKASCDPANDVQAKYVLTLDDKPLGKEVTLLTSTLQEYEMPARLGKGKQTLTLTFTNDEYKEGEYDRNLYIHGITIKKKE